MYTAGLHYHKPRTSGALQLFDHVYVAYCSSCFWFVFMTIFTIDYDVRLSSYEILLFFV